MEDEEIIKINKNSLEYLQVQDMIETREQYLHMTGAQESALGSSAMKSLKKLFK